MTAPQREVIGYIEENLGVTFTGTTMEEARLFISEHMEASRAARIPVPDPADVLEVVRPGADDYYFGGSV